MSHAERLMSIIAAATARQSTMRMVGHPYNPRPTDATGTCSTCGQPRDLSGTRFPFIHSFGGITTNRDERDCS